ncbi:MAG: hypothetical protein K0S76_1756 [Herbinix sp.]|nr:hypothetical protein [Herbinix sp.]
MIIIYYALVQLTSLYYAYKERQYSLEESIATLGNEWMDRLVMRRIFKYILMLTRKMQNMRYGFRLKTRRVKYGTFGLL